MDSVCARSSRAVVGQLSRPITSEMVNSDGPRTVARISARGRYGITRNHSVTRNRIDARQPSKKPDIRPTIVPITIEITLANRPTNSEIREPQIRSDKIERPFSSVPSQYSLDGGSRTPPVALVTEIESASAS